MSRLPQRAGETTGAQPVKQDDDLLDVTVLAVDDIEDNLDLIEELLEDDVWSVLRAQSGDEAVRVAAEYRPDVILLDVMMPMMNGLAVLRAFRANTALQGVPVILQTAYADKENAITAHRLGCDSYLCKPLTRDRLLSEMGKCLECRARGAVRDHEQLDDSALSHKVKELTMTLQDVKTLLETSRLADDTSQTDQADCFRNLIPDNSTIGERLIRVANSPAYGGRFPARTVAEAVVRIGLRETKSLIRKASSTATQGISTGNVLKALELLELLTALFPDRTSTPDGTLSLLVELNGAAQPKRPDGKTAAETVQ